MVGGRMVGSGRAGEIPATTVHYANSEDGSFISNQNQVKDRCRQNLNHVTCSPPPGPPLNKHVTHLPGKPFCHQKCYDTVFPLRVKRACDF